MSFAPVVPLGGYAGWAFLKRTGAKQAAAFQANPELQRDEAYFRARIGSVRNAEELVSDRRLLKVALGAFGLDGDIANRFFIRKVLDDGTTAPKALANRLSDKSYRDLSQAFGFGDDGGPRNGDAGFADAILARYADRQFEIAVGEQSETLRLALHAERELPALAGRAVSDDAKWYTVMGSAPLRAVFQTAFGLPASFAAIDIDQQLGVLKDKAQQLFGDDGLSQFADPERLEGLLRRFTVLSAPDTSGAAGTGAGAALQLLQAGRSGRAGGAAGILSLLR